MISTTIAPSPLTLETSGGLLTTIPSEKLDTLLALFAGAYHPCWSEELATDLGLVDSRGREWYRGRLVIQKTQASRSIYLVGRTVPRFSDLPTVRRQMPVV